MNIMWVPNFTFLVRRWVDNGSWADGGRTRAHHSRLSTLSGNDKADERVQWGKETGPYARLREGGGEGETHHGAA